MTVRFPTVDEYAVSLAQLIGLSLVGKFTLTRQDNETQERHQIRSLGYVWVKKKRTFALI